MKRTVIIATATLILTGCNNNQSFSEEKLKEEILTELQAEVNQEQTKEEQNTFAKWTDDDVFRSFRTEKVEFDSYFEMSEEDYGLAPRLATEAYRIQIPSLGEETFGHLFIFEQEQDLLDTKAFYDHLGQSSALLFSWTVVRDNVLFEVSGEMPEEQMLTYEHALYSMDNQ
ncbi:MAG: membrane lipoprotein lipid attachment site-containing protein [Bacillus sp. (in: firmicutes)]